jgi:hypothetical protein
VDQHDLSSQLMKGSRRVRSNEDDDNELRILRALGVVPNGMTLGQFSSGGVAGVYQPRDREVLVVDLVEDRLVPFEKLLLSHELEHAVADQALGLPVRRNGLTADENSARAAVVEGDATLTMQRYWFIGLTPHEQMEAHLLSSGYRGRPAWVPHYLARRSYFPYAEGFRFVCSLYKKGGWSLVDTAHTNPPSSTAEILFPDRYGDPNAWEDPLEPRHPGGGWAEAVERPFGADEVLFLFESPGNNYEYRTVSPRSDVDDIAGAQIDLWTKGRDSAVALVFKARRRPVHLCLSINYWYTSAMPYGDYGVNRMNELFAINGPRQDAVLVCEGQYVTLAIAPDLYTARMIARSSSS